MKTFLIISLIVLFIALIFVMIRILLKIKNDTQSNPKSVKVSKKQQKQIGIRELLEAATDNSLNKNDLFVLCESFLKMSIPTKKNGDTPMEAKEYLDFILLIASHKNADAKLISHLNTNAKKRNPSYVVDIDNYEKNGLEQRSKRR